MHLTLESGKVYHVNKGNISFSDFRLSYKLEFDSVNFLPFKRMPLIWDQFWDDVTFSFPSNKTSQLSRHF